MEKGKVKFFDEIKGYGFILLDSGEQLFVHYSNVEGGDLAPDAIVECEIQEGPKGKFAANVKQISTVIPS